jgi:hypothetical protein
LRRSSKVRAVHLRIEQARTTTRRVVVLHDGHGALALDGSRLQVRGHGAAGLELAGPGAEVDREQVVHGFPERAVVEVRLDALELRERALDRDRGDVLALTRLGAAEERDLVDATLVVATRVVRLQVVGTELRHLSEDRRLERGGFCCLPGPHAHVVLLSVAHFRF